MTMRLPRAKGREQQAFTLVELLVSISIIALLLGILVPTLNKVRGVAKRTVCQANLHASAVAFRMYLDNNNDILPPAAQKPFPPLDDPPKLPIADFLKPYLSSPKSLKCPGDVGDHYFKSQRSSYEYNFFIGGQKVGKTFLGTTYDQKNMQVLYDYDAFHGKRGQVGAFNYLYADGHIGDRTSQN
jgi:prepilin-type N-terminal cleavage/methylation domain-containing protein/prepilin-type processing-associated H-X9-DG protein